MFPNVALNIFVTDFSNNGASKELTPACTSNTTDENKSLLLLLFVASICFSSLLALVSLQMTGLICVECWDW